MGILWTIIIGAIAGFLAKLIHRGGNEPSGFILTTLLGIVGAFVGFWLGGALGFRGADAGAFGQILWATIGAIIVLVVWGLVARRRT